ncbi:unnamed protein product, partial [Candidula unifasciata]
SPSSPMLTLAVTPNSGGPMKSSSDVKSEAIACMGLLRRNEVKLMENAKLLLKQDREFFLKVFTSTVDEWTLIHACTLKGVRPLVKIALKAGVDPNLEMGVPDGLPGRCTPLHLAAHRGDVSIIELLVQFGAQVNKQDNMNYSPLHYALRRGNTLAAKKLLKFGADPSELSREERIYFRNEINAKGSALLCIPVRVGSQKHKHNSSSLRDKTSSAS